jgi:peptide/nickel transport system permease protein
MFPGLQKLLHALARLLALLIVITTVMFFALRMAGDPVAVLAGEDASIELVERIRAQYGLDQPLWRQYFNYMGDTVRLNFGNSMATGQPALEQVLSHVPATLLLAVLGMFVTITVSVPVGAWLGMRPGTPGRRALAIAVFITQGVPGYIVALVLIQIFVVTLGWLPSLGYADALTWILPGIALAFFLAPKLIRVISANVTEAMRQDYVRTARANGASLGEVVIREALPNALLGATALLGTQFAFLVSGAVLIEVLFLWPGIGLLLLRSAQALDFPVLQALAFVIAVMVFVVNAAVDIAFEFLDPRLHG